MSDTLPTRCTNTVQDGDSTLPCPNLGEVHLRNSDGRRVPGGRVCRQCAAVIVGTLNRALGWSWSIEKAPDGPASSLAAVPCSSAPATSTEPLPSAPPVGGGRGVSGEA